MFFSGKHTFINFFIIFSLQFYSCNLKKNSETEFYLNHNDTVDYVGINTCKSCHYDKYETFIKTGMGQSFHKATKQKSAADFITNHIIYDSSINMNYMPFLKNNELYIMEYRLKNSDTVYKQTEKIDFIIGSGQHTNSHLIFRNGYIYQAPLTWYTQTGKWDLPPGFEKGRNSRFTRIINEECMSCHNAMPVMSNTDEYKFLKIGDGIDCERCHGPGELHVNIHKSGKSIKNQNGIDRTIVNPSKLEWQRQVDVCQRCHLQGNAVLKKDKSFLQFRPGMKLSDFYEVYMPEFKTGNESEFIMASHAQRLQKSQCFIKSNNKNSNAKLTCITCHNPHITVKETKSESFNSACKKCHNSDSKCSNDINILIKENYNCIKCHLPSSGTSDIPHVQIHDHYIRKKIKKSNIAKKSEVVGLYCVNNPKPEDENLIRAYLTYYEKFDSKEIYLKNARNILDKKSNEELEIHYLYLKGEYKKLTKIAEKIKNADAWTNYRIAQSYINTKKWADAENYLQKAVKQKSDNFEFLYKLSEIKQNLNKNSAQEEILKQVISLNPKHTMALNDLGFMNFKLGNNSLAFSYYMRSYNTNPDFLPVLKNLFDYYFSVNNKVKAVFFAKLIIEKEPSNVVLNKFIESEK